MIQVTKISKLDSARRQLDTAIILFFNELDDISIHTLTCAAQEILLKIGKEQKVESIILDKMLAMVYDNKKKYVRKKFNEAKVFFKHGLRGNKDLSKTIDFNPSINDFLLWDASLMYQQITCERTDQIKIFMLWFYLDHNDLLLRSEHKSLGKDLRSSYSSRQEFYRELLPIVNTIQ